jgi:hypothetical protein
MPIYREVLSDRLGLPVIVAGSHSAQALRVYTDSHSFPADRFEEVPVEALPVRMTPAMLLVDPAGIIRGVWTGRPSVNARRSMVTAVADASRKNAAAFASRGSVATK